MTENSTMSMKILKMNKKLPRYTSYPTSLQFNSGVGPDIYSKWLGNIPDKATLSLYLHIPFCRQLCWYCGCHTKATQQYAPVKQYVSLLIQEIGLIANRLRGHQTVTHIHFGGGSPTILNPDDFEKVMSALRNRFVFDNDVEIAMELDPRRVSEAKVAAYAREGVNRVSLGVQDFNEDVQTAINRRQPFRTVYQAVTHLREYGIDRINLDLMYGLPNQTVKNVSENISTALLLRPDRLAIFGYAHVPWMKKHMRLVSEEDLPKAAERIEMSEVCAERLQDAGYTAIGLDHFAIKGDDMEKAFNEGRLRRNFQGYTTDASNVMIGFGVSSIGKTKDGYVQNTLDMHAYKKAITASIPATIKGFKLSPADHFRHELIEQIMCYLHVNIAEMCRKHDVAENSFDDVLYSLEGLENDGLISISGRVIKIHPEARQVARNVSAAFDLYLAGNSQKHSQVA